MEQVVIRRNSDSPYDVDLKEICLNLHNWFVENDFKGHDPYLMGKFFGRYTYYYYKYNPFPKFMFYFIRKIILQKAIGLIIRGNVSMYRSTGDPLYLDENKMLISLLAEHKHKNFKYPSWGWPFRWNGGGIIYPKDYPIAVVSSEIGHAILDHYECTHDKSFLRLCEGIGNYLIKENGYKSYKGNICFHYTNILPDVLVHNTNVYTASFLARLNNYVKKDYSDLITKAIRFTLSYQNEDGSWYYYAPPFLPKKGNGIYIDNRHTGFTLVALKWTIEVLEIEGVREAIENGWRYYRKNFFEGVIPKSHVDQIYPIDMHDISQAIITSSEFDHLDLAKEVALWAILNMSNKKDEFYYRKFDRKLIKIPFFRWNQAWMYRALTLLYQKSTTNYRQ
jgi:hypothetical protein